MVASVQVSLKHLQRGRDIPQLPGHLSTFMVRNFSFYLTGFLFLLVPVAFYPTAVPFQEESDSVSPVPPDQGSTGCSKDVLRVFSLPGSTGPLLSASPLPSCSPAP